MKHLFFFALMIGVSLLLFSCSKEKLATYNTYDRRYEFQLIDKFKLHKYPDLNYFLNGKYRIGVEVFPLDNIASVEIYEKYQDSKEVLNYSPHISYTPMEPPVANDNGYPYLAFYGNGKDKSVLWPSYFEGYLFLMKTSDSFVYITLQYESFFKNGMNKEKAIKYLTPMLKTFKDRRERNRMK